MHNYVLFAIIVHFNIQKLKNKQTFIQTEKAKSSHFDRTRGDKNQIFPTKVVNENFITAEELKKKHEKRKKKQKEKRDKNKAMDVEGVTDMKLKGRKAR